ncbi:MAG: PH domain-containing protein [Actinomycetota bacterium]|nr:PH domain-containing protein [Actinomycetota bacterium]
MSELARDQEWQRLDPRMMLVHPIREVGRFIIPLLAVFVAGAATERPWQYLTIVIPIALGLARYLTTRFRIAGGRVELKRGLFSRHVLSTQLERVRTVDLTASPIHRILGLTTVRVGTGTASTSEDERLDLDGLPVDRARRLRDELLRVAPVATGPTGSTNGVPAVVFDPSWLRFAPFTSAGVVMAAALLGAGSQLLNALDFYDNLDPDEWSLAVPIWTAAMLAVVGLGVAAVMLSVIGYLVTNWAFRLGHADGSWHVSRGLLTTRETSLDDERVAGISIGEPLGLRAARGARLNAIATGLRATQQGSSALLPPAPREVIDRAAIAIVGSRPPVLGPLQGHGPAARRRRYVRALTPTLVLAAVVLGLVLANRAPWWLLVTVALFVAAAAGLAADRSRALGHLLVDGYLVARSGSLLRSREVLGADHVIGWTFRSTFWQRRVGLTSMMATTAGGGGSVTLLDVPEPMAVGVADAGVPGLVAQFLE